MDKDEPKLKSVNCPKCEGHGWQISNDAKREICQYCFGRGFVFVKDESGKKRPMVPESPYD